MNSSKWLVVHEIEKLLPISPYDAEWAVVERGTKLLLYRPISHVESWVPWVFLALHLFVCREAFPWAPFLRFTNGLEVHP